MVRAPAAGAHPPLHAEAAARRDRAGRGARLPALPVRLAAGDRRRPAWKGRTRSPRCSASSKGSRRRPAPGRPRSCRRASPGTIRPGSTTSASPAASPGPGCGRAHLSASAAPAVGQSCRRLPGRCGRRRSPCSRAGTRRCGPRCRRRPIRRRPAPAPAPSPISSASTAPRSSTSWSTARGCCGRRSRRRWPSWWRWGWSVRTASPGCARC